MGLRPTKGDESRSVVRPVADAPGSVTEPEHGTPSVSEGLGAALLSGERFGSHCGALGLSRWDFTLVL